MAESPRCRVDIDHVVVGPSEQALAEPEASGIIPPAVETSWETAEFQLAIGPHALVHRYLDYGIFEALLRASG